MAHQKGSQDRGFGSRWLGWAGQLDARSSTVEGRGGASAKAGAAFTCRSKKGKQPSLPLPTLVTVHNPRAHPVLRFALLSPQVWNSDGCSQQSLPSGMCIVGCMWWWPQLHSDGGLQVHGSQDAVCIQIPLMYKLPCKTDFPGSYFPKPQLVGPWSVAVLWLCSWCASPGAEASSASGAACLHQDHSAPNCSMVSVGNQQSPRPQAHLELVTRSLLQEESLHMWERLLAPACFLTTGAKSKCIGSCYFCSFLPDSLWNLQTTSSILPATSSGTRWERCKKL